MNYFKSWKSYLDFEITVKKGNRYFRDLEIKQFLDTVLKTCKKRKRELKKGSFLWRAQLGHDWEPYYQDEQFIDDIPCPYSSDRMKPLKHKASEGRANPKGIPYLYTSTTKETAMAEVRPWLKSPVSVGQFETNKKLILIDCSVHSNGSPLYLKEPDPTQREKAAWSFIDKAFSKPITNDDKSGRLCTNSDNCRII